MTSVTCITVTYGPSPVVGRMRASLARSVRDGSVPFEVASCVVTQPDASGSRVSAADGAGFEPAARSSVSSSCER